MTLSVEIQKDDFGQDIIEGKLCITHCDRHTGFGIGYILETRKKIKVAKLEKHWQTKVDVINEYWYDRGEVLMFNEDNIFNIMDGELLHQMATLRAATAEHAAKILAKKEKKRVKLASNLELPT